MYVQLHPSYPLSQNLKNGEISLFLSQANPTLSISLPSSLNSQQSTIIYQRSTKWQALLHMEDNQQTKTLAFLELNCWNLEKDINNIQ